MALSEETDIAEMITSLAGDERESRDKYLQLVQHINYLVNNDFEKLLQVLYKVDVDEKMLKKTLAENQQSDAGALIADLLIERQKQKIKCRNNYGTNSSFISEDEKW